MEDCFSSGWAQCQPAMKKDSSFDLFPWPSPPSDSASTQYSYGFPAAFPSCSWPIRFEGAAEDRAASASKSHSQAEKRRRDRINAQLATLRKLIPMSDKMDKAALLGSVVEHVRDLKRKASEVTQIITAPSDVDEVTVDCHLDEAASSSITGTKTNRNTFFFTASICCDDRPQLFAELNHALKGLRLTTVRADITSLGGRTKSMFQLCSMDGRRGSCGGGGGGGDHEYEEGVCMNTIKQSLKVVLSRIITSPTASHYRIKSKRQRFFLPSHDSQS